MTNFQPLDNLDIMTSVLRLDPDTLQVTLIGHLLQRLVDDGTIAYPIEAPEALESLFELARVTDFPNVGGTLTPPQPADLAPALFPVSDMADFLRKTLALIRFSHAINPHVDALALARAAKAEA